MQVTIFQLLTIGGTTLWKEDDSLDLEADILSPNGIYLHGPVIRQKELYLCPVDVKKTQLTDFYQWTELSSDDTETFCWRTVYVTGESKQYRGWLPIPTTERLDSYSLQDILDTIHGAVHLNRVCV